MKLILEYSADEAKLSTRIIKSRVVSALERCEGLRLIRIDVKSRATNLSDAFFCKGGSEYRVTVWFKQKNDIPCLRDLHDVFAHCFQNHRECRILSIHGDSEMLLSSYGKVKQSALHALKPTRKSKSPSPRKLSLVESERLLNEATFGKDFCEANEYGKPDTALHTKMAAGPELNELEEACTQLYFM